MSDDAFGAQTDRRHVRATWDSIGRSLAVITLTVIAPAILGLFGLDGVGVGVVAVALVAGWSVTTAIRRPA